MISPVVRYMLQPSGDGYLLPDWYGAEPRRHYVSVTHTKKKKWPLFMKHWRNAVRKNPCFTKMKWIFISTRKSVLTDSYAGSKSALSHRARMKSIILPVNRPGFPGECFICELRLPDHRFRWKHNKLFLLLPVGYGPAFPAIVDCYTSPPT